MPLYNIDMEIFGSTANFFQFPGKFSPVGSEIIQPNFRQILKNNSDSKSHDLISFSTG